MTTLRGGSPLRRPTVLAAMATARAMQANGYLEKQQLLLARQHAAMLGVSRAQTLAKSAAGSSLVKAHYLSPAMALVRSMLTADLPAIRSPWDPPNWSERWWATDEWRGFDALNELVVNDGIPVIWVPRAEVVQELFNAADTDARLIVLLGRQSEIIADCRAVVASLSINGNEHGLARRAIDAYSDGHVEAGQALAVLVTDRAVRDEVFGGSYKSIPAKVRRDLGKSPVTRMRLVAAFAPLAGFYTEWYPGQPPVRHLSRHVSVHHARHEQYTQTNALVATMLMTSIMRAMVELDQVVAEINAERQHPSSA